MPPDTITRAIGAMTLRRTTGPLELTARDLAEWCGINRNTAKGALERMAARGIVERTGYVQDTGTRGQPPTIYVYHG